MYVCMYVYMHVSILIDKPGTKEALHILERASLYAL